MDDDFTCPECGCHSPYMNVGRRHWGYCERCAVKWWIGDNLFSTWHDEGPLDWAMNDLILADFTLHVPPRSDALATPDDDIDF